MKKKLFQILIERNIAKDEKAAHSLIMAARIYTPTGKLLDKPGSLYRTDIELVVKSSKSHQWVSRAGIKLDHALKYFELDVHNMIVIDIGCSTGGFTQVLLEYGVQKVFAVDVGYGEIDWKLRNDPRIHLLERTNARYLTIQQIPDLVDLIVCDASFISLTTILPASMLLAQKKATIIALIKPQFEVPKDQVGKGGIIREAEQHQMVIDKITDWFKIQTGWKVQSVIESPIKGTEGNKEFLIMVTKNG